MQRCALLWRHRRPRSTRYGQRAGREQEHQDRDSELGFVHMLHLARPGCNEQ